MSYRSYQAFGLAITSTVDLPELSPGSGTTPDVSVRRDFVPESLPNLAKYPVVTGVSYQASPDQFLLKIDRVASYLISSGSEVIFDPSPDADADLVQLFLTGSAFGALLFQRGLLPLHGSAIATPKGAVLFVGSSGNGKSTLAGAFHQRGYPVLSDDVSAITITEGLPQVLPAYPRLLLWADAVARIGVASTGLRPAHARDDKFQVPVVQGFASEATPLHAIYALAPTNSAGLKLTALAGFAKLQSLIDNTYRLQFLTGMGLCDWHFRQISALAQHVHVARAERPVDVYRLEELVDLLEKDFLANGSIA